MSHKIAALHQEIELDPWREQNGFSAEVEEANRKLFDSPPEVCEAVVDDWLGAGRNQPCLFGKTAAKLGLISYCILTQKELDGPDEAIRDKIQAARTEWTREGFLAAVMKQMEKALAAPEEGWDASVIDSLERALGLARKRLSLRTALR